MFKMAANFLKLMAVLTAVILAFGLKKETGNF